MDGSITSEGLDLVELDVGLTPRSIDVNMSLLTSGVARDFTFWTDHKGFWTSNLLSSFILRKDCAEGKLSGDKSSNFCIKLSLVCALSSRVISFISSVSSGFLLAGSLEELTA